MILGCGRSGTSIFGELFESLGPYQYASEPAFTDMLATFGHARAVKVPTESDSYPADPGLSFPLGALMQAFPATRIFWIVRHPLDAICSLRIGIGQGWRHHPRPPDWQDWFDRPLLHRCAHHWAHINTVGYSAVQDRATVVRFEDMLRSPVGFAASVCAQLALPWESHAEQLRVWCARVQDTNNEHFIEAMTSRNHSRPDHTVRIGRWQENLTREEVHQVVPIIEQANRPFGYDLFSPTGTRPENNPA